VAIAVVITISSGIDTILVPSPNTAGDRREPRRCRLHSPFCCVNPTPVKRITPMRFTLADLAEVLKARCRRLPPARLPHL
jgi:hypothetical protein